MDENRAGPVLSTARLDLWRPQAGDLGALVEITSDPEVRRHLAMQETSAAQEFGRLCRNAGSWVLYGYGTFVCRLRDSDEVVGICGVFHSWRGFGTGLDDVPEIGWIFARHAWGHGFATEAARAALAWFDGTQGAGVTRISCMIEHDNHASMAIAAKLGFVVYGKHVDEDGIELVLLERV